MIRLFFFLSLFFINVNFPGYKSFGSVSEKEMQPNYFNNFTNGGLGGTVIKVTNLNSSGAGSLREALEAKVPRVIVFEAGGIIDLKMNNLEIEDPFVTIAGQTAPHPGITIIKGGISVRTHDVIIKHIMVRPGDAGQARGSGWKPDGISVLGENAHHVLIDHCSITWSVDENLSVSGSRALGPEHTAHNVTLSNNIIAEALCLSSHPEGMHSMGTLIHDHCQSIVITGNLYAHNADRNPFFKLNTTGVVVNNIIYNPASAAIRLGYYVREPEKTESGPEKAKVSIVGNVLLHGNNSGKNLKLIKGNGCVYAADNNYLDLYSRNDEMVNSDVMVLKHKPVWVKGLKVNPADHVVQQIIKNVGARPAQRAPVDQRIINDFINQEGKIIDSQEEVGGYPNYKPAYRPLNIPEKKLSEWLEKMEQDVL